MSEEFNNINETPETPEAPETTTEYNADDIQQNRVKTIFAYLSWLVLIPIFAAKDSKFARFHANQGLVIAIIETISWVVFGILSSIPYIGILFTIADSAVSAVCVVFSVLGIINVAKGVAKELPIIGKIKILK